MAYLRDIGALENGIRSLATRALSRLPRDSHVYALSSRRIRNPVNYMRRAEFASVIGRLKPVRGWRVMDAGGPQWLTLHLASVHPDVQFEYVNIFEEELTPFADIARCLGLQNVQFHLGDLREAPFDASTFDLAYSISVLEHVEPESGGDVVALNELSRIVKRGALLCLTVPCKKEFNVIRRPVPSGGTTPGSEDRFYAREYDLASIHSNLAKTPFRIVESLPIAERTGLFARDYWEWGPGRGTFVGRAFSRVMNGLERTVDLPFERWMASRYLRIGDPVTGRLVNVAIVACNDK